MMEYKISIITVCRNEVENIESTIKSVINQSYKNIEYIVIDGNSSDGTYEVIEKYSDSINMLIHEADDGVYSAMNKGALLAKGDYILFMNGGDSFYSKDSCAELMKFVNEEVDVVYGETRYIKSNTESVIRSPNKTLNFTYGMPFCHQSSATKTSLVRRYPFVENQTTYADFLQYSKIKKSNAKFHKVDRIIANYDSNGISAKATIKNLVDLSSCVRNEWGTLNGLKCYLFLMIRYLKRRILG